MRPQHPFSISPAGIPAEASPAAFHGAEIPYVFNGLDSWSRLWKADDWKSAAAVSFYGVNLVL
jgi:hypothetical protein